METQNEATVQPNNPTDNIDSNQQININRITKKRHNLRFYIKVVGVFLLLTALMFSIAAGVVFYQITRPGVIEKILTKKLSEITHTNCKFGKVEVSFPSIYVKDVQIATDTENIYLNSLIGEIAIRPSFLKAFKGELFIDYLSVASSTTDLKIKKHPQKNQSIKQQTTNNKESQKQVVKNEQKTSSQGFSLKQEDIPFNSIALKQIKLVLNDIPANETFDISLNNAALTYSFLDSSSLPVELDAEIKNLLYLKTDGYLDLNGIINTNIKFNLINFENIKKYIPKDYISYLKQFNSAETVADIKYDINSNLLSLKNAYIAINPGLKANINADFSSLSPVEGKIEAILEPVKTNTISTFASPYFPSEYKIALKNGDISAKANIEFIKDKNAVINAQIIPSNIEVSTSLLPETIKLNKGSVSYNGSEVTASDISINAGYQQINIPTFTYKILNGNMEGKINANAKFDELLKFAKQYIGESIKDLTLNGTANAEAQIKGTLDKPDITVNGKILDVIVSHSLLPEKINLQSADLKYQNKKANILNANLLFANQTIKIPEIGYDISNEKLNGNISGKLDITNLWKSFKPMLGTSTADIDIKGNSDVNILISGTPTSPKINGKLTIVEGSFSHPLALRTVEHINGPAEFDLNKITCNNVTAYWGKSKAVLNGNLKDYSKLISDFSFTVNPLDITDAAGFFLVNSGYTIEGLGTGKGTISGDLENIKVLCEATAPNGKATMVVIEGSEPFKFPYTNLNAKCEYYNSVFTISTASMNIFDGSVTANGKFLTNKDPIEFEINSNINMIQTQSFLKENLAKYQNSLTGPLKGSLKATGTTAGLSSLKGNADITAPEGTYNCPDAMKQIVSKLKTALPKFADKINEEKIASGTYKNLIGNYRLENGSIISDNALANFEQGNISFSGSIGLDATIKGNSKLTLSREACLKDDTLKQLIGNKESFVLPISIKGSLTSPDVDFKLDDSAKAVLNEKKDELINKGLKSLQKFINGNSSQKESDNASETQKVDSKQELSKQDIKDKAKEAEKKLKQNLKKLFK